MEDGIVVHPGRRAECPEGLGVFSYLQECLSQSEAGVLSHRRVIAQQTPEVLHGLCVVARPVVGDPRLVIVLRLGRSRGVTYQIGERGAVISQIEIRTGDDAADLGVVLRGLLQQGKPLGDGLCVVFTGEVDVGQIERRFVGVFGVVFDFQEALQRQSGLPLGVTDVSERIAGVRAPLRVVPQFVQQSPGRVVIAAGVQAVRFAENVVVALGLSQGKFVGQPVVSRRLRVVSPGEEIVGQIGNQFGLVQGRGVVFRKDADFFACLGRS